MMREEEHGILVVDELPNMTSIIIDERIYGGF